MEQFTSVVSLLPDIETALNEKGINIKRPQYGVEQTDGPADEHDVDSKAATHTSEKSKANHEATSDEDED